MLKAFCDGCGAEMGVVPAGRQDSRARGHNRNVKGLIDGTLVMDVQLHVIPSPDQHVCAACARRALDRAWSDGTNTEEEEKAPAGADALPNVENNPGAHPDESRP